MTQYVRLYPYSAQIAALRALLDGLSTVATSGSYSDLSGKPTLGSAAAQNVGVFATAAQGALADSAVQPGDLADVATTGDYDDLTGKPPLGGLAAKDTIGTAEIELESVDNARLADAPSGTIKGRSIGTDGTVEDLTPAQARSVLGVATAAQGTLADTALQPNDAVSLLSETSTAKILTGAERTKLAGIEAGATANATNGQLRDRSTHTGVQAISTVTGLQDALDDKATSAQGALADSAVQPGQLADVATSGDYDDLNGKPTLGSAAAQNVGVFATAAQGGKADTAVQPADIAPYPALLAQSPSRTGEARSLFSSALTTGPLSRPIITAGNVVVDTTAGTVLRISGDDTDDITGYVDIAPRIAAPIYAGRTYLVRYHLRRNVEAADPANNAVELRWQNLNYQKNSVSNVRLGDPLLPVVDDGVITYAFLIGKAGAPGALDYTIPPTAIYGLPYIRVFGNGQQTDIIAIEAPIDVTDDVSDGLDIAALAARVTTIEADKPDSADLAAVAFSGSYGDLLDSPPLGGLAGKDTVGTAEIDNASVNNAKLANMAAGTIKGRAVGAGTGAPQDLTAAQAKEIIGFQAALEAGDIISLSNVAGTGDAVTADFPASHSNITPVTGIRMMWTHPANNSGPATLTIASNTISLRAHNGTEFAANALVAGRTYMWRVRGDGTMRLLTPVIPADIPALTLTQRTNGDLISLASVGGTGDAVTASLPASHADITITAGTRFSFLYPAANTGTATITIGGVTYGLRTISGQAFTAGQLKTGYNYVWYTRGDLTMRLVTPLLASEIQETSAAKVMTAAERTLLASISTALATATPYDEGYVLVFDPATATFALRPADDIGGIMSLKYYDESTTIGTSAVELLQADTDIKRITIQNLSETASVAIAFTGSAPGINTGGITLGPGAVLSDENMPSGAVNVIASEADVPITVYVGTKGNAPNWSKRADALIARSAIATTLPTAYTDAVRELYRRLDGAKVLKDALYFHVLAGYDAEFSGFDWGRKAGALTPVGSPVFTSYLGWSLDGSTQHFLTGRKWSDQALVTASNVAMMVWVDTTINGTGRNAISSGDTGIEANRSSTGHAAKAVSTGNDPVTGSAPGGMLYIERRDSAKVTWTRNAANKKLFTRASNTALTAYNHAIGSIQTSTGPTTAGHWAGTPKFAYAGPPLTDEQQAEVYAACNAYLTTVGGL